MDHQNKETFFTHFISSYRLIFSDVAVVILLIGAPIFYGFFYPLPYQHQQLRKVLVAVIDYDQSTLSRQIIRYVDASPKISSIVMYNEESAKKALWERKIEGLLIIPSDLKRNVYYNKPVKLQVFSNGSYPLINKNVLYGFSEAIGTVSAGIEIKKSTAKGLSKDQAIDSMAPINLNVKPKYNLYEGYGYSIVPAVLMLILQQTLLIASAMFAGRLVEEKRVKQNIMVWLVRIFSLSMMSWAVIFFYFGWLSYIEDFPRAGNIGGLFLLAAIFSPTIVTMGFVLGLWFKDRERSLQILITTSIPLFFSAGIAWPSEALPYLVEKLRWIIPSTSAMHASIRLNQMGASISDVSFYLLTILLIGLIFFLILLMFNRFYVEEQKE